MPQSTHSNCVLLEHPCGARVMLVGTQHVSLSHGSQAATTVEHEQPLRVLLELDEARFQQVDFRLRHLMHADTASLMDLAADPAAAAAGSLLQRLLPDALLWAQHMQQFALMRNEGVPLLLGSLYGADFLQAALAATALPQQASLVLADQPQHVTHARFKALTDTMAALRRLLGNVLGTAAYAEAAHPYAPQHLQQQDPWQLDTTFPFSSSNSSNTSSTAGLPAPLEGLRQAYRILTAAAALAAGRMVHLCLQWWSMALTSQARWYGDNIHPVFLLVGDTQLQQKLQARGCVGVTEAAAAAGRLLEVAAAAGSSGSSNGGMLPAVQDLQDIRRFVASLERIMWEAADNSSSSTAGSRGVTSTTSSTTPSSSSQVMHWLQEGADAAGVGGGEALAELLPLRPWWVTLSESFSNSLARGLGSSSTNAAAGAAAAGAAGSHQEGSSALAAALQGHSHANVTAAAAYDRAVVAERNRVLVAAMWQHAEAAAAEASEEAAAAASGVQAQQQRQQGPQGAAVVAVVGYNHVPGIVQLWRQLQSAAAAAAAEGGSTATASLTTTSSSRGGCVGGGCVGVKGSAAAGEDAFLPWQVTLTDAAAGVMELAAAGGAGLAYWAGVHRWGPAAAAAAAAGSSSSSGFARAAMSKAGGSAGLGRLGLLLLPAALALLPLQRDAKRLQEAGGLLSKVAVVNDVILQQEANAVDGGPEGVCLQGAGANIMQLACKATAATAAVV